MTTPCRASYFGDAARRRKHDAGGDDRARCGRRAGANSPCSKSGRRTIRRRSTQRSRTLTTTPSRSSSVRTPSTTACRILERSSGRPGCGRRAGTAAPGAVHGIENVIAPPARFDSEGVLELPAFSPMRNRTSASSSQRGNGGRELLAETLRQRGAEVDA